MYQELIQQNKYSEEEVTCFGNKMAHRDAANGMKQILTYYGAFTTNCEKCAYQKFGFKTKSFAPDDWMFPHVNLFIQEYNSVMKSSLSNDQLEEIKQIQSNSKDVLFSFSGTNFDVRVEDNTDSTSILYASSCLLEDYFDQEMNAISFQIVFPYQETQKSSISYIDLKTKGVRFSRNKLISKQILFYVYLNSIPNRYEYCICSSMEGKYAFRYVLK